jgi:hypothetical protein
MRRYEEREAEEKIKLLELEGKKMEAETTKLGYRSSGSCQRSEAWPN